MEELKKAYELLGVSEDANQEEIENRYFLLLKRHKSKIKNESAAVQAEEEHKFEEVNKAYQMIKAHLRQQALENNPIYQAEQKSSPFRRNLEHFLSYYKIHVLGGLVALVIIISFVHSIVTKEPEIPADVSAMMVGAYYAEDFKPLESKMAALVPGWQRVKVIPNFTPNESMQNIDPALLQKSMVIIATERPEIYIADPWQFKNLGQQGAFLSLEPWKEKLLPLVREEQLIYAQLPGDSQNKLYGIDFKDSPIFQGISRDTNAKIFTIRTTVEDPSKALQLIVAMARHK
jgi:hypothetical protein